MNSGKENEEMHQMLSSRTSISRSATSVEKLMRPIWRAQANPTFVDGNPGTPTGKHNLRDMNQSSTKMLQMERTQTVGVMGDQRQSRFSCLVIRPEAGKRVAWDLLSAVLLAYEALMTPLSAFSLDPPLLLERLATIFWTVDIIITFLSGYPTETGMELRLSRIACHYMKRTFFMDLTLVLLEWLSISGAGIFRLGKLLRLTRVLRMMRIMKAMSLLDVFADYIRSETKLLAFKVGRQIGLILVINHFVACGWWAVGVNSNGPGEERWVNRFLENEAGVSYQYMTSIHWALTQFTPASMEVFPTNLWERVYANMMLMAGLGAFSSLLSSITAAMTHLRQLNAEQVKEDADLRRYLQERYISQELANRILAFLKQIRRNSRRRRLTERGVKVLAALPDGLLMKLHWEAWEPVVLPSPIFYSLHMVNQTGLTEICHRTMSEKQFTAGHEVFEFGQVATRMYFVGNGVLDYIPGKLTEANPLTENFSLEEGSWISEMALWMMWHHKGTLMARRPCEVLELDVELFQTHVSSRRAFFYHSRAYARLFVDRLHSEIMAAKQAGSPEDAPNDLWGNPESLQDMICQAMESEPDMAHRASTGSSSAPKPAKKAPILQMLMGAFAKGEEKADSKDLYSVKPFAAEPKPPASPASPRSPLGRACTSDF